MPRKNIRTSLLESDDPLQAILSAMPDGLLFVSQGGVITRCNAQAAAMFGYEDGELVGQRLDILLPESQRDVHPAHRSRYFKAPRKRTMGSKLKLFGLRKDQSTFPVDISLSTIPTQAGVEALAIIRDVSGQVAAEEKLERRVRERTAQLTLAKDEAEKANQSKGEFLSRMSHELRTPMNAILGYAQILELTQNDPRVREATGAILRAGRHLLEMINEVLDLSRIESNSLSVSLEPVELSSALREAIAMIHPLADAAGIHLDTAGSGCKGVTVRADRQRLTQVLVNLLSNAIKYNREGGSVMVRCLRTLENSCRIEISDTGTGIPEKDLSLLFQPFQRLGSTGVEGTGLGLALSKRFVELMDGTLGLAVSTPKGSTFYIDLQLEAMPDHLLLEGKGFDEADEAFAGLKGTILYIEDNFSNLRLLEFAFASAKELRILSAMHGQVGLDLARKYKPNLILLDLNLPDMSGSDVLAKLKADSETSSLPVVILSADATPRQVKKLLSEGAVAYLTKPLDIAQLVDVMRSYLSLPNP